MNTKTALTLLCIVLSQSWLRAEWTLSKGERLEAPAHIEFIQRTASQDRETVEIYVVSFNPTNCTLAVMDNPEGDFSLATAAQTRGALAAVNGGYFHPNRIPLGLVVRQGKTLHPLERAKLLSGIVAAAKNRVLLMRVGEFKASPAISDALQAGPFLIDDGKPVAGLNATRSAARTVVFVDDTGRCGFFVCRFTTLAETALILATRGIVGDAKIVRALNLDGGSSTGLWVKGENPFYLREGKEVRNYLAILKKRKD